ncbi:peptidoglycan-binding protein [Streptomyces sp. NPDC059894]|uniref:peptidoglycan-binding domain-containing protein n=1 Tax=unclassified Streptomyces TaxID=2593676 RepID=UPI0036472E90
MPLPRIPDGTVPQARVSDGTTPVPPVSDATRVLPSVADATAPLPSASDATRALPSIADPTRALPSVTDATAAPPTTSDATVPGPSASEATMTLRAVDPAGRREPSAAALPTPLAPAASEPSATDLSLFEAVDADGNTAYVPVDDERPHGRRRRTLLVACAGAAVAVVAAAGFASGLFSYETPSRDGSAADDVRAAVPDTSRSTAAASAPASRSASPSASSASPSPSESESSSPSPSASSASPSASETAEPSPSTPTAEATGSLTPESGADEGDEADSSPAATVLQRGDRGPEVTELQLRLRQLYLYNDDVNGVFTGRVEEALRNFQWARGIQGEELGVYGAATRAKLEAETKEP